MTAFYGHRERAQPDAARPQARFASIMSAALAGPPPALTASLGDLRVRDAMHEGVISCTPETTLRAVARMLATYRVHALVVLPRHEADAGHSSSWSVISDLDLVRAAEEFDLDMTTAERIAGSPVRCVQPDEPLVNAVLTMTTNALSHVIVIDRRTGRPLGVVSALDVARALAGYSWADEEC